MNSLKFIHTQVHMYTGIHIYKYRQKKNKQTPTSNDSMGKFYQISQEQIFSILFKLFQTQKKRKCSPLIL